MKKFDIVLITDPRYNTPAETDWYIDNVLLEDRLLKEALENLGLHVYRTAWDDPAMDWNETRFIVIRAIWDYFHRMHEFTTWLERTEKLTRFINPASVIRWNMDKHYLRDLAEKNIPIPPTVFIATGETQSLQETTERTGWADMVLKPAVSGAARHTYKLNKENIAAHEEIFQELISSEAMLLQEFQHSVLTEGEVTYMVFGGKFSHAVRKRAQPGDFRVQDDFGGTLHEHEATEEEIQFAEYVVNACTPLPAYARVDVIRDNTGQLCVSELELIEPELWFRRYAAAASLCADAILQEMERQEA